LRKKNLIRKLNKSLNWNFNADVKDSEHADEIRDIDKKIKSADSLKPKNCNCDFLNSSAPATDVLK
jgi:hypothetical protein